MINRFYSVVCGECPLNQVGNLLCSLYLIIILFKEMWRTINLQFSHIIYSLHKSLIVTFCHIIKYRILIFHDPIDITFAEGVNPVYI